MALAERGERVAIVTIDNPPVNALPVAGWFELADALRAAGRDPDVRVVILRAEAEVPNLPARRALEGAGFAQSSRTAEAITYDLHL